MMSEKRTYKKDSLLIITDGEYSEFGIIGLFKVKKTFSVSSTLGKFGDNSLQTNELLVGGYVEEVDYSELWIGEGHRLDGYHIQRLLDAPKSWTRTAENEHVILSGDSS